MQRDFAKARNSFERALKIDSKDSDSNYYMGLIYLMGLGVEANIPKALSHFENTKNDSRAMNAIGYIYFKAPDFFEKDPALLNRFGDIRKDLKKARDQFEKAA